MSPMVDAGLSASWFVVGLATLAGVLVGLGVAIVLRLVQAREARELVETMAQRTDLERRAYLDTVVEVVRSSVGTLSTQALGRSADEVVRLAKSTLETERAAAAREFDAKTSLIDRQIKILSADLGQVLQHIKGLEGQKSDQLGGLTDQLRVAREHTSTLIQQTASLANVLEQERRREQDALRGGEAWLPDLAAASPLPLALCRLSDGTVLRANERFADLFGLPADGVERKKLAGWMRTSSDAHLFLGKLRKDERVAGYRVLMMREDRTPFTASLSARTVTVDGVLSFLLGVADVSAEERLAEEAQANRDLLATVLESTSDGLLVVDQARRIVSYNQKFVEMWKLPPSVLESRNDNHVLTYALSQVKTPEAFLAKVKQLYAKPEDESYDVVECEDGRLFERYSQPRRVGDQIVGRIWSYRDITERKWSEEALEQALKENEDQLRQSQKLEAIGRLAGGIAHDFNNLLTIITGYSQCLLSSLDEKSDAYHDVAEIRKATKRASGLTQQLLAFSRKQARQPTALDLNEVVTDLTKMLRRLLGEDIHLVTVLAPDALPVWEDPTQLEQVVVNLAVNARDAMPTGGTLTVETGAVELDEAFCRTHPGTRPGAYVRLTVKDTGVGMDAKTLAHCFEPFFTTKPQGQGTGLGLATVYGIVKQAGGAIDLHSKQGWGTSMTIYMRWWSAETGAVAETGGVRAVPRGSETVLVVEDDTVVRALIRRIIEQQGYRVLDAVTGPAALELAAAEPGDIHLLVTDVVMPQMQGPELVGRMGALRPGIKALYLTGYGDLSAGHRMPIDPGAHVLQKPFTPDQLATKVREVLDTGATEPTRLDG